MSDNNKPLPEIKFLQVSVTMEAKASAIGADKALNKFGNASIILSICFGLAALIPAVAFSVSILLGK